MGWGLAAMKMSRHCRQVQMICTSQQSASISQHCMCGCCSAGPPYHAISCSCCIIRVRGGWDDHRSCQAQLHRLVIAADSCMCRALLPPACRDAAPQQTKQLLQELLGQLHQLTDTPALAAVSHPAFWQLAQQASAGSLPLSQDLQLLGYDLAAAASSAAGELQQLQQLLALDASELQQQLLRSGRVDAELLQPGRMKELLAAVAGDAAARQAVAGLQLLQVLGQALGLSSVQLVSPVSACDLLARLTGRQQQPRELAQGLQQQLSAAAPQLLAAVQQLPAAALEQATVGSLLQLLSSKPELQVRTLLHGCCCMTFAFI